MGFKDLFRSKKRNNRTENQSEFKNIEELLGVDLSKWPDDSFDKMNKFENEDGTKYQTYELIFQSKFHNLFDYLELLDFQDLPNKNFIFHGDEIPNLNSLKRLLNEIVRLYGIDNQNLGKFNQSDKKDIREDYWAGRMWTDPEIYETPLSLGYDSENGITLTIYKMK